MSRQQPFPTPRRANKAPPVAYDARFDNTPPLTVNRPSSRPMTPSSSTGASTPTRPARSERRPRHASQYSISSISSRDMPYDGASVMSNGTAGPSRSQGNVTDAGYDDQQASPVALKAVLNAFQQAGAQRKRAMTNGTLEREKERERELEEEAQRQRRIKDKVPGRRVNGRSKAVGGIDCESLSSCICSHFMTNVMQLCWIASRTIGHLLLIQTYVIYSSAFLRRISQSYSSIQWTWHCSCLKVRRLGRI